LFDSNEDHRQWQVVPAHETRQECQPFSRMTKPILVRVNRDY
jgi:hypothetical protein